jgi:hypothetical protein
VTLSAVAVAAAAAAAATAAAVPTVADGTFDAVTIVVGYGHWHQRAVLYARTSNRVVEIAVVEENRVAAVAVDCLNLREGEWAGGAVSAGANARRLGVAMAASCA